MRAALLLAANEPLVVTDDVELAPPQAGEVLVKVHHCGLCHSDVHFMDGSLPLKPPMLCGHEAGGTIEELGPGVTELAAGQPGPGPWGATPRVFQLTLKEFADDIAVLSRERFGPAGLVITYPSVEDLLPVLAALAGNLVGTVHVDTGSPDDLDLARQVVTVLEHVAGRVVCNGWPTGVAVVAAQHHGGPWPATTVPAYTSVGTAAIRRWLVPVAYQDFPPELLPLGLR